MQAQRGRLAARSQPCHEGSPPVGRKRTRSRHILARNPRGQFRRVPSRSIHCRDRGLFLVDNGALGVGGTDPVSPVRGSALQVDRVEAEAALVYRWQVLTPLWRGHIPHSLHCYQRQIAMQSNLLQAPHSNVVEGVLPLESGNARCDGEIRDRRLSSRRGIVVVSLYQLRPVSPGGEGCQTMPKR